MADKAACKNGRPKHDLLRHFDRQFNFISEKHCDSSFYRNSLPLVAKIGDLAAFSQEALLVLLLVFALVVLTVCWPGFQYIVISGICSGNQTLIDKRHSDRNISLTQNSRIWHLTHQLLNFSNWLIDLCQMHQTNMLGSFNQERVSLVWVYGFFWDSF